MQLAMRTWISLAIFSFGALSCRENPKAQAEAPARPNPPAPLVAAPAEAERAAPKLQSEVREEAFIVRARAAPNAAVGVPFDFTVTLEAQAGYKVNPEYPIKFIFDSLPAFAADPAILRKEQGTIEEKKAELKGAVRLTGAGQALVSGKLSFSVCTDARCLIEKRDLSVSVVGG